MDNNAFFKIGYGLYILAAAEGEKDNGCIVNAVMQVTNTPNRIVFAVNKANYTCEMISRTGVCTISVLDERTSFDTFRHFGFQSGRDVDKFSGFSGAHRAENGVLYVTETTNAYFALNVISQQDLDTHILFTADVTEAEILSDSKTATYDYYQEEIKPKPEEKKGKGWRCKICGYVYEGETLPEDYICPLCKHPASDFEQIL